MQVGPAWLCHFFVCWWHNWSLGLFLYLPLIIELNLYIFSLSSSSLGVPRDITILDLGYDTLAWVIDSVSHTLCFWLMFIVYKLIYDNTFADLVILAIIRLESRQLRCRVESFPVLTLWRTYLALLSHWEFTSRTIFLEWAAGGSGLEDCNILGAVGWELFGQGILKYGHYVSPWGFH